MQFIAFKKRNIWRLKKYYQQASCYGKALQVYALSPKGSHDLRDYAQAFLFMLLVMFAVWCLLSLGR